MKMSKLDKYVRSMSPEGRAKGSGLDGSKNSGDKKGVFAGFTRMKDALSGITHGHNAQRMDDANRYSSVESGTKSKSSMGTGGSSEYVKHKGSEGLNGKKGSF